MRDGSFRVLVADDERLFRLQLRSVLERAGFAVSEAADGEEALLLLTRVRPDAVVLDWRMPGGGLATARQMIEDHGLTGRLIMVTGLDDLRDRRAAHKAGVWCYLTKPIDQDELLRAVDAAVRGRLEQWLLEPATPPPRAKLDPRPLEGLRRLGAFERNELLSSVIVAISQLLDEIRSAVAQADMPTIARLAHRGLNDAAAVGAGDLAGAFALLQAAARGGEPDAARDAVMRLREAWPATRAALADLFEPRSARCRA